MADNLKDPTCPDCRKVRIPWNEDRCDECHGVLVERIAKDKTDAALENLPGTLEDLEARLAKLEGLLGEA